MRAIYSISVSATDHEDTLIWRGMANGVFLMRSAYHIQKEQELAPKAGGSSSARINSFWRSMWQLKIPNVDKHFLWRACHGIFPTKVKLCERKMLSNPICPIYERELETIFHTLWQCPAAGDVWSGGGTIFQKSCYEEPNFLQVVEGMLSTCDKKKKLFPKL